MRIHGEYAFARPRPRAVHGPVVAEEPQVERRRKGVRRRLRTLAPAGLGRAAEVDASLRPRMSARGTRPARARSGGWTRTGPSGFSPIRCGGKSNRGGQTPSACSMGKPFRSWYTMISSRTSSCSQFLQNPNETPGGRRGSPRRPRLRLVAKEPELERARLPARGEVHALRVRGKEAPVVIGRPAASDLRHHDGTRGTCS